MNLKILHFFIAFFSLEDIWNWFSNAWQSVCDFFSSIGNAIANAFQSAGEYIWGGLTEGFKSAYGSIEAFAKWLYEHTIGYAFSMVQTIINTIWNSITGFFSYIGEAISQTIFRIFSGIKNAIYQYIISPIVGFFSFLASLPFPFNFLSYVGVGLAIVLIIATAWNIAKRFIPVLGGWL